ncbi:hypothetical protein QLH52_04135 [Methylomonas sp. OY6]|uniref:CYTH domain-containing protein n=1 Tax=Methylomonas defluvii TaxID=3045149 RepID=A0ABU4UAI6_9GAMM|nr:hypothetical protein [Methylomonas sp. OY6]MDX8126457.1 hypothetical protein [Methylomonas sp. OY6]
MNIAIPTQRLIIDKIAFTTPIPMEIRTDVLTNLANSDLRMEYSVRVHRNNNGRYANNYTIRVDPDNTVSISAFPKRKSDNFLRVEFNPAKLDKTAKENLRNYLKRVVGLKRLKSIYFECRVTRLDLTVDIDTEYSEIYAYKPGAKYSEIFRDEEEVMLSQVVGSEKSDYRATLYNKCEELGGDDLGDDLDDVFETRLELRLRNLGCSMAEIDEELMSKLYELEFYDSKLLGDRRFSSIFTQTVYGSGINLALDSCCNSNQRRCYRRYLADHSFDLLDPAQLDFQSAKRQALKFLISKGYQQRFLSNKAA